MNKTSFGWDEGTMTTNYNNLKGLCDGGDTASCAGATQIKDTNATIDSTLVWMKKNMTAVGTSINNFKGLMNSFKNAMGKISNGASLTLCLSIHMYIAYIYSSIYLAMVAQLGSGGSVDLGSGRLKTSKKHLMLVEGHTLICVRLLKPIPSPQL